MCQQWDLPLSVLISSSTLSPTFLPVSFLMPPILAAPYSSTIPSDAHLRAFALVFPSSLISLSSRSLTGSLPYIIWFTVPVSAFHGNSHMPRFNFSYSSYYGCLNNHQTLYSFIQKLFCSLIYSRALGLGWVVYFCSTHLLAEVTLKAWSASILWRLILTHARHLGWKDSAAGLRHCLYLLWNYHMVSFSKLLQVSQTLKHWGTEGARWKSNGHLWPTFNG